MSELPDIIPLELGNPFPATDTPMTDELLKQERDRIRSALTNNTQGARPDRA